MQHEVMEQWLVLLFGNELALALAPKSLGSSFHVDGVEYRSQTSNFLTTFYDRITDDSDRLVGIRIWPAIANDAGFLDRLPRTSYLQVGEGFVDVWLSEAPVPSAESTADQAFGGRIYESAASTLALSLDVNYLCASEADFASVRAANARWVSLT